MKLSRSTKTQSTHRPSNPRSYRTRPGAHKACEAAMQAVDPEFTAAAFLQRFSRAFILIQKGWSKQDLRRARQFVSDGIYERFTLQIQEQRDMGYRDHMEQIRIRSACLAEAQTSGESGEFDVLTVEVKASAIDYRVSVKTGEYLAGNLHPEVFIEFWSFVRRSGVRSTSNKRGLIEGNCPNCGDSLKINQVEKCASCDAWLRSGEYDWVLSEITQGCVWRPDKGRKAPIARRYRELHDPGFNIQHIEDRASVIFWRKAMADRLGDTTPLLKVATKDFCALQSNKHRDFKKSKKRRYHGGCSVGAIELVGIVQVVDYDYALVEVHWSANIHSVDSKDRVRDHGAWNRHKSLYVLMRQRDVRTSISRVIDSAHCPNCGAPESEVASHACAYCEAVLNDGAHDWVLHECHESSSESAQSWLHRVKNTRSADRRGIQASEEAAKPSYADLLAWATKIFAADKVLDKDEKEVILNLARKQGMSKPMLLDLIKRAGKRELDAPGPSTSAAKHVWLGMMVDVALLDGKVEPGERRLLANLGKHVGYKQRQIDLLIDKRRVERSRDESGFFDAIR